MIKKYIPMTETTYYTLLSLREDRHGYAIMQFVSELTENRIRMGTGTLYTMLGRLTEDGMITIVSNENGKKVYFEKGDVKEYYYTIDSKRAVNRRRKRRKQRMINDPKDINQQNNDWQVQSVQDAQELGLQFTSAYGNNQIIYRSDTLVEMQGKSKILHMWAVYWILLILIPALIGFAAGWTTAAFFKYLASLF